MLIKEYELVKKDYVIDPDDALNTAGETELELIVVEVNVNDPASALYIP